MRGKPYGVRGAVRAVVAVTFLSAVRGAAWGSLFVSPIGGTPYEDWTIVNYVDLDPGGGVLDYLGGNYTYNGHNAIDYTLPNFVAMDAGVTVHAAAGGTVLAAHDGEFDKWSRVNPNPGHQPNYVVIEHPNGVVTEYLHLKKNSITVGVGETVTAGQVIGEVGSSGNSSDAHLHFAVYNQSGVVETYQNPSQWWIDPLPYSGDVPGAIDHGVVNYAPTTAQFVDRPDDYDVFRQVDGGGQVARLWSLLHGIGSGDDIDAYFYRPDGTEYAHWHWTSGQIRYGWWTAAIGLPSVPDLGAWQIDFQHNGVTIVEDTFLVVEDEVLPGDFNADGVVNGLDANILSQNWFGSYAPVATIPDGDANGDGYVNGLDANIVSANWLQTAPASVIPEPGSVLLLVVGVGMLGWVRGRRGYL